MTLGERIVHYRKRQGLSQEQLSQRLGVSRQSVSKWERDESLPEADKLPLLAKTLGVSLDALLSGEEEAPPQPAGPTPAKGGAVGELVWLFRRWGRCARPLWGFKSSPWPSWWWAGWPLLEDSSRRQSSTAGGQAGRSKPASV